METLNNIKQLLDTSKNIQQVVNTMKVISSVNMKKYEKITQSIYSYKNNIDMGLQAIMTFNRDFNININDINLLKNEENSKNLIVIFGSNQGLCGRFNDRIINFLLEDLEEKEENILITVGDRLSMIAETTKLNIIQKISIPHSVENIYNTINTIISKIDTELKNKKVNKVFLYYTTNDDTMNGTPTKTRLIPMDKKVLQNATHKAWPTNNIPYWQINTQELLSDLLRQYIFLNLNSALVNSISSEQKNRLITLQNAEKNIKELIATKTLEYNQKRQTTITSELIDVITGYTVNKKNK